MNISAPHLRMSVLFFSAVLVSSLMGCHETASSTGESAPVAPVAIAERAPLANTLHVAGEFFPFQEVELHAKVAGYVRHISVDIGDKVKAGRVLATLDVPELNAQVQGADAGVRQTQQQITRARSEVAHARANYAAVHSSAQRLQEASNARPGLIAQQELDDVLAKDRAGAAEVDSANAALLATQQQLGVSSAQQQQVSSMAAYSRITAPFSGVVTWRYADTGALIQAGTANSSSMPVVKMAQVDKLRLRLPVPESLAGFVHIGNTASIHVQALNKTIEGKVARTTAALDATTRSLQVELDVPNPKGELTPGMYADVTLNIERSGDALVVPINAVDQSSSAPWVLVVNTQNKVEHRDVRLGITTADRIEIISGVQAGERVIIARQATYQPGETVTPKQSSITGMKESE